MSRSMTTAIFTPAEQEKGRLQRALDTVRSMLLERAIAALPDVFPGEQRAARTKVERYLSREQIGSMTEHETALWRKGER